jgi:hypothetical protein
MLCQLSSRDSPDVITSFSNRIPPTRLYSLSPYMPVGSGASGLVSITVLLACQFQREFNGSGLGRMPSMTSSSANHRVEKDAADRTSHPKRWADRRTSHATTWPSK